MYALYFNYPETSEYDLSQNVPFNVHLCSGPDLEVDYEFAVKQVTFILTFVLIYFISFFNELALILFIYLGKIYLFQNVSKFGIFASCS